MNWKKINEEKPPTGKEVLVFFSKQVFTATLLCVKSVEVLGSKSEAMTWETTPILSQASNVRFYPTHWHPIPELPKT